MFRSIIKIILTTSRAALHLNITHFKSFLRTLTSIQDFKNYNVPQNIFSKINPQV
jgi:hypothetical protein